MIDCSGMAFGKNCTLLLLVTLALTYTTISATFLSSISLSIIILKYCAAAAEDLLSIQKAHGAPKPCNSASKPSDGYIQKPNIDMADDADASLANASEDHKSQYGSDKVPAIVSALNIVTAESEPHSPAATEEDYEIILVSYLDKQVYLLLCNHRGFILLNSCKSQRMLC